MASREEINSLRSEVYELERQVNKLYTSGAGGVQVHPDSIQQMQTQLQRIADRIGNLFSVEVVR